MRGLSIGAASVLLRIAVVISLKRSINEVKVPSCDGFHNIYLDNIEEDQEEEEDDEETTTATTITGRGNDHDYDFYRNTCPQAETIVRSKMAQIVSRHNDVPAALLRLFFHDCFVKGCDASVILTDSKGERSNFTERQAVPNRTLKGFDILDLIKEEVEKACPGVVSCADILALATRDGILLVGGPFYPVFTGRRDSIHSYFNEAVVEIPNPDGNLSETLHLFGLKGFDERETVTLLGAHNIGKISCEFIQNRLYNFLATGQPDPSVPLDFLNEMRINCQEIRDSRNGLSPTAANPSISESTIFRGLTSISSGAGFDNHFYQNLVRGRGLLFSDQQLMADEKTARYVRDYAFGDGSAFRTDFARVMVKISILNVLTGFQGQVRTNCSLPLYGS
ncbi:putative Peroxidase 48 [Herrania umbratica]|uniref:Peroxidase n=1 Tax=Herrania umbratica TaxID=108875 RepID=A0A6J1BMM3_9ROSI|nr:putative Peroxidase 48 [Herrania umbratica]